MTSEEIVALAKKHTIFEWTAQQSVDPIPVARAKGVYFWTPDGKRYIDFNSQLMCVNIGHSDPRVVKAIAEQAATLCYVMPGMATEPRARLGAKLAAIAPGDPRRWSEPSMPGVIHVVNPYHGIQRGWDSAEQALEHLEETIQLEGPN